MNKVIDCENSLQLRKALFSDVVTGKIKELV